MESLLRVRSGGVEVPWTARASLGPAGATQVDLADLVGDVVVLQLGDPPEAVDDVLLALRAADRPCVVATAAPVTDTLKRVGDDDVLLGTADREQHRLVGTPFAAPLAAVLAVRLTDPTAAELLAGLAAGLPVIAP